MPIVDPEYKRKKRRKKKRRAVLKDPESTGRKEAALLYPLNQSAPCEWSRLYLEQLVLDPDSDYYGDERHPKLIAAEISGCRSSDGGLLPFRICEDNTQVHRHHGPDKNTLNNEEGNVHRICSYCHNMWHAIMDPEYKGSSGHD